jgi:phage gpG-like protein
MTPEEFQKRLKAKERELKKFINDDLPRHLGKLAVDHFKDNFRKGGFVNNGLKTWKKPKRFSETGSTPQRYGTLLSATNELFNSINYDVKGNTAIIRSDKEYSAIHNWGGTINSQIPVTPKMRKFAWAMHYQQTNGDAEADSKWKGLALTKKEKLNLTINMPQRQFIGHSKELDIAINELIEKHLTKILEL